MDWLVTIIVVALVVPLTIAAIVTFKTSGCGKGRVGGVTLAIGLAFGAIFDPATKVTVETVQKKKDLGDADQGESGELVD